MTDNPTLPPAEGPEYTPCACGHIEPDHDINGRWCASDGCECSLYRPVTTTDHSALRQQLAQALARHDAVHARYSHGFAPRYGVDPETDGFVDAVTAVMGATADRAAVLREAIAALERVRDKTDVNVAEYRRYSPAQRNALDAGIAELRRMAAESAPAAPPQHTGGGRSD